MRKSILLFPALLGVVACATMDEPDVDSTLGAIGPFNESSTSGGHTFTLTCGTPEGYIVPGNANVAVICEGRGSYKTADKATYKTEVVKFRDAMNTAAAALNKKLETAAAAATPALKVICDLPPNAGDKPGIDADKCPATPWVPAGAGVWQDWQSFRLGALVNANTAGVYGYCSGWVTGVRPLELLPKPQWRNLNYEAWASWTCVVLGQADSFNQTDIPKPGPSMIDCPFPASVGSEKGVSCDKESSTSVTIGAEFGNSVGGASFSQKFGEKLTLGIDLSHETQPVFLKDGTVTKLRSGSKVNVTAKAASAESLDQEVKGGFGGDIIGFYVKAGTSEELTVGRGASNSFTTTKDLTQAELEAELKKRYAMFAGIAATVASMNDNKGKFESIMKKSTRFVKKVPKQPSAFASAVGTVGAGCEEVDPEGTLSSTAVTDPITRHDILECEGEDDLPAPTTEDSPAPTPGDSPTTGDSPTPDEPPTAPKTSATPEA